MGNCFSRKESQYEAPKEVQSDHHTYDSLVNNAQAAVNVTLEITPVNRVQSEHHFNDSLVNNAQAAVNETLEITPVNRENCLDSNSVVLSKKDDVERQIPVDQPYATESNDSDSIDLKWKTPKPLKGDDVFHISYKEHNGRWKAYETSSKHEMLRIRKLKPMTTYYFRVRIVNDKTGEEGPFSTTSHAVQTAESPAFRILRQSKKSQDSIPPVYTLPIEEDKKARNLTAKTRKFTLGDSRRLKSKEEKTIMMVGATGSGKSTLINAMANYVVGVTWEDNFRFTLVNLEKSEQEKREDQAQSQTEWVTCYTIYPSECSRINYTINLIDTPGFGDTRGLDKDKNIADQIRELFSSKEHAGVDSIDAVCFIVKAPDSRLTITQKYIFDSILALFGNDIQENICTLVTFADGLRPPVLDGIRALKGVPLPFKTYFSFNNSALFVGNDEGNTQGSLSPQFWEMGIQSCDNFFRHLITLTTKSLTLTAEVLNKRYTLQNKIHNLQIKVESGMGQIGTLEDEIEIFTKYKDTIRDNIDFEYISIEQEIKKIDCEIGQHTTTCTVCNLTCHENCKIALDKNKIKCVAMKDGMCTECPNSCSWDLHFNTPYIVKSVPVRKKKRYEEKLKKYQEATKQKLTQEQVIDEMKQDIVELDNAIQALLGIITRLTNRLKEIALRPDPMDTVEYIELLIDNEQREKQSGFRSRIDALQRCKDCAKYGEKVQIFQDRFQRTKIEITKEHLDKASNSDNYFRNLMKHFKFWGSKNN